MKERKEMQEDYGVAKVVERLPSKFKALSLNPSTIK
jgi:hypothetical protein